MTSILTRFVLGGVFVLAGCSSSSSGDSGGLPGSQASCKNTSFSKTSAPPACASCILSKCGSETSAALGNDTSKFGGACGDALNCECACANQDTACEATCGGKITADCQNALKA